MQFEFLVENVQGCFGIFLMRNLFSTEGNLFLNNLFDFKRKNTDWSDRQPISSVR